ncbi:MAG: hypothetical protein A2275_09790 [Bacteroidetes bacterium RIFOXYA12_FULL_35_11]|nr:MAG: hypothetical protein A2X01_02130 [Bacteroidetes bacterium GWF2_35_48]OFY82344.1 MAG: hypothetical protein A2275_09790 [Bacteroidetes bacterium RIFOXYA12_FULL_35_11]HBX49610.1 response regulator [Bacteroidales bacterium]
MDTGKQMKIFIVEDNNVFALALKADIKAAFIQKNVKIHTFQTGETCMDKFKELKPDVVILDYHLNSKFTDAADGIKVLDWIKNENKEAYVIMLTGDDNIDIALKSFKHGAADYIVKSDTKLRKIIFSLFNLMKIMEAKRDAKRYKNVLIATSLGIAVIIGVIIAFGFFSPSLLL